MDNPFPSIVGAWRAARVLPALIAGLALMPAGRLAAQSFTDVYDFTGGSDGANPMSGLTVSNNTIYGTAPGCGDWDEGTVFSVQTNGAGFAMLHCSTGGSDGGDPMAGLVLSGNMLYGTASSGGDSSSSGTVFAVKTDGTGFNTLYSFTNGCDGNEPLGALALLGNRLYGTVLYGGNLGSGVGTMFSVNTNGTDFTPLNFPNDNYGCNPLSGLTLSGLTLYGATSAGGGDGEGTIFSLTCLPPRLAISCSTSKDNANEGSVTLTWPASSEGFSFAGFTLQSSTSLCPAAWNDVSTTPALVNGQYTVPNPISGSPAFYRLCQKLCQ
jgi:uncharacterized repeat protein (TIGR03803 family)